MAAAGLAGASLAVACGSAPKSPSKAPGAAAVGMASTPCHAAAEVRSSLNTLTSVKVNANTAGELAARLRVAKAKLTIFSASAMSHWPSQPKSHWPSQARALESSLGAMGTAVDKLVGQPSTATISRVLRAQGDVSTAGHNLLAAVDSHCSPAAAGHATPTGHTTPTGHATPTHHATPTGHATPTHHATPTAHATKTAHH